MSVHSIHHVTAVTARIKENMEFFTKTLGLRLVKKSVNQDDVSAYHLFYADAVGSPGTDMTFFDWPMIGANVPGAGSIALTTFRVPGASLDWWESRLLEAGSHPERGTDAQGRANILFADSEGQRMELADDTGLGTNAKPWDAAVPADNAIRGILGVTLESARPDSTVRFLTEVFGYRQSASDLNSFEVSGPDTYGRIRVLEPTAPRFTRLGAGGVHHVAFRMKDEEEQRQVREQVIAFGLHPTDVIDRYYFKSVYFREPGGILFEMATDGPGFAADESQETLGEKLALPPFLESRRQQIEAGLKPLVTI